MPPGAANQWNAMEIAFVCLSVLGGLGAIAYVIVAYRNARSKRPAIAAKDIIFQESFGSGRSLKNLYTRFAGARGCLRLVVTKEVLLITSWFPFSLIAPHSDLEHAISRNSIASVEPLSTFGRKGVQLRYVDASGDLHCFELFPKDLDGFLDALAFPQANPLPTPEPPPQIPS